MSVFLRKGSPYYYAEFQIKGRRFLRSTGKTVEREAKVEERRIKTEVRAKVESEAAKKPSDKLTLDQAFGLYWTNEAHKLALTWRSEVKRYSTSILTTINKDTLVSDVTDAEVDEFVQGYAARGGGRYSLNRALAVWRRVHNLSSKRWKQQTHEIDWGAFTNDEIQRVRHVAPEDARRLMDCTPPLADAIEWSLLTGCRRSETFSLTWDDIDLQAAKATVIAKGGRPHTLWLTPDALALLARMERRGRYVFDKTNWRKIFEAGVKRAGLENFRWHDLRHCHATWLRQAGVPLEVVQRSLGHADLQTTMRYAHVADSELADALHKLPSLSIRKAGNVVPIKSKRDAG